MSESISQIFSGSSGKKIPDPKRIKKIQEGVKKADKLFEDNEKFRMQIESPSAEKELEDFLNQNL